MNLKLRSFKDFCIVTPMPNRPARWPHRVGAGAIALLAAVVLSGCAAQNHRDQGLAALSVGDPVSARHHLRRALEHDRDMGEDRDFARAFHVARRDAAVLEGRRALDRGEAGTDAALERFGYALELQPGFGPAQEGLAEAQGRAAEALHGRALAAADAGDLDTAEALLHQALDHVPGQARVRRALASLRYAGDAGVTGTETVGNDLQPAAESLPVSSPDGDERGNATPARGEAVVIVDGGIAEEMEDSDWWDGGVEAYVEAQAAADAGRWNAALRGLAGVVERQPDFLPARAAIPATRGRAAAAAWRDGDAALAAADYAAAAEAYRRVLTYRPDDEGVRAALGRVDLAQGDAARGSERFGRALLHYRAAARRLADAPERAAVRSGQQAARAAILDRYRTSVSLTHASDDPALAGVSQRWARGVSDRLDGGGVVRLADASAAPSTAGSIGPTPGGDADPIRAELRLLSLSVPPPQISTRQLQHRYEVAYQAVNPELSTYRSRLHHLEFRVGRLRRDWHSCRSSYHASLHLGHDHHRVKHLHYRLSYAERDYHAAQRDYHRLHRRYATLSPTVMRYRTEYWDYRVETHQRRAELAGQVIWDDQTLSDVTPSVEDRDRVVLDARPDLGLREDPLRLRDDASLEAELLDNAADRAARELEAAAVDRRRQQLQAQTPGSTADDGSTLEARVAAAVLLSQIAPRDGERELAELERQTMH